MSDGNSLNTDQFVPRDVQRAINIRLAEDPDFKSDALRDFSDALRRHMKIEVPMALTLRRVGDFWSVTPASDAVGAEHSASDDLLSDADLDLVSGGTNVKVCENASNCFDQQSYPRSG